MTREEMIEQERQICLEGWKQVSYLVYSCKPGTPKFSDEPAKHMGRKSFADAVGAVVRETEKKVTKAFDKWSKENP